MNFFNIKKITQDLAEDNFSSKEKFYYFLWTSVFSSLFIITPIYALMLYGLYKLDNRVEDESFIYRFIFISVPVITRTMLLFLCLQLLTFIICMVTVQYFIYCVIITYLISLVYYFIMMKKSLREAAIYKQHSNLILM